MMFLQAAAGGSAAAAEALRQQLKDQVKTLADNYMTKQQQLLASLLPAEDADSAAAGVSNSVSNMSYDKDGLLTFCEALSDFDVEMNQVVVDAGCLAGGWQLLEQTVTYFFRGSAAEVLIPLASTWIRLLAQAWLPELGSGGRCWVLGRWVVPATASGM
jgi:hypothetical protein